jgi:3-oxoadipate enol-lactonase
MPDVDSDGVTIDYDREGPRDAPSIVFVEGLGYGKWMWKWVRDPLAEGFDTLVFDNRGTGASDAPAGPYTISEMATDLEAVLAHADIDRAHIVGASMGGMIAQQYAIEHDRAASLTLICTTPGGNDAVPIPDATADRMMNLPSDLDQRDAFRYKMEPATSEGFMEANPELIDQIIDWRLATDAPDPAREAQIEAVGDFDASDALGDVSVPVLIVHGTADRVVPVENAHLLADLLPNATLALQEGAPHWVFIEEAETVAQNLREFIHAST